VGGHLRDGPGVQAQTTDRPCSGSTVACSPGRTSFAEEAGRGAAPHEDGVVVRPLHQNGPDAVRLDLAIEAAVSTSDSAGKHSQTRAVAPGAPVDLLVCAPPVSVAECRPPGYPSRGRNMAGWGWPPQRHGRRDRLAIDQKGQVPAARSPLSPRGVDTTTSRRPRPNVPVGSGSPRHPGRLGVGNPFRSPRKP